jgi:glycine/D-amino acid oxidase-like deaminating enzyme
MRACSVPFEELDAAEIRRRWPAFTIGDEVHGLCVAIGAGHAFKFASVLGRVLSEIALDGTSPHAIGAFALDRPVLRLASPPRTYMV